MFSWTKILKIIISVHGYVHTKKLLKIWIGLQVILIEIEALLLMMMTDCSSYCETFYTNLHKLFFQFMS
jgi:hypothetical protein